MTTLALTKDNPTTLDVDAIVVAATKGPNGPRLVAGAEGLNQALNGGLAKTLGELGFTGAEDEALRVPTFGATTAPQVIVVGAGETNRLDAEAIRRAAGTGMRAAAGTNRVAVAITGNGSAGGDALRAVCEGALLGAYDFVKYRVSSLGERKLPPAEVVVVTSDARNKTGASAVNRAEIVAAAVALARDLTNEPPGNLHPKELAEAATAAAADAGCEIEVLDEKALRKGGYGGIMGVGQGSANPPRLIRIAYRHPRARRHIAFVGKGITFDSGGLSLKPAQAMEWMKCDMAGAAAVIAAVTAIARLGLRINVTGWAPTAENMPSGAAIRPSDVLTMYGGKRVEVMNTDAEGRLILGDAIARASEDAPDVIVDAATLTGASLVALGTRTAGVMSNDDDLRARVVAAADRAGELAWPMPLPPELRKAMDSDVADFQNTGDRNGGMLVGGLFLKEFVGEGISWAHIDMAGPAWNGEKAWGYTPKGGTGAIVRTIVQFAEDEAALPAARTRR